ncbi:MAG: hypothetical protein EXQ77_04200 [Thermoleophilia bacterium]|nr:hypothetical protein [Thermoleophilia bacterium]
MCAAFDADALAPGNLACFMPGPGGLTGAETEARLVWIAALGAPIVGLGFMGLLPDADPDALLRIATAGGG